MEETWTILKVLQWTTGFFSRKGIEQPRANAEVLLAYVLGMNRIQLYLHYDQPLTADELARYRETVRRRSTREPTQYITGSQEFWSLDFEVTPAVLIPRPETELLVEKALEILGNSSGMVLDLGTGSGALAVSLAHERPQLKIVASDCSPDALLVARHNASRHHVGDRIFFVAADLLDAFSPSFRPFDIIVSNPPYIGETEFGGLAPEVRRHEPGAALRGGGTHGLDVVRRILHLARAYLKAGGALLMEVGQGQAEILTEELTSGSWIESYEFLRDYSGILRVLVIRTTNR